MHAAQLALDLDLPEEMSPLPSIRDQLLKLYGPQRDSYRLDPTGQFVRAMLGKRTQDHISSRCFEYLRCRYPSWDSLADATPEEVKATIWQVTHADKKAVDIPRALRIYRAQRGLNLDFLADLSVPAAMQFLTGPDGVGTKVAATTLNFSYLRMRTLSVDTHVLRFGERIGLYPTGTDYEEGYDRYMRLVPDDWGADDLYEFHWLVKLHGQRVCRAPMPLCGRCPFKTTCRHYIHHHQPLVAA
jgi:endonuclease-3